MGTFALVQLVAPRVRAPVIAAGGIVDARGVRAAMTLGAQAAQIGTAFLACTESGASDAHRAALFGESTQHTTLTRAFSGRLARGLRNRWTEHWSTHLDRIAVFPLQSWFASQLRNAGARGRTHRCSLALERTDCAQPATPPCGRFDARAARRTEPHLRRLIPSRDSFASTQEFP
jgi:nitronate monooxygenase